MPDRIYNLITFSSLYPNRSQPYHGIFVQRRLTKLIESDEARAVVVAPVPWFPFKARWAGRYATFASVPRNELSAGISVSHPRYVVIPKVGMGMAPALMALGSSSTVRRLIEMDPAIDLIDAHYLYPDGVAAALLARRFKKPLLLTARGSDVNVLTQYALPRRQLLWTIAQAARVITVSDALRNALIDLGVAAEKIVTLRNGVDLSEFYPSDQNAIRNKLQLDGRVLLSVGTLNEAKGHHLVIRALSQLPDSSLMIVGAGNMRNRLQDEVTRLGLGNRVRFAGLLPKEDLRDYYNGADALVLASSREGMPNVLLEANACGLPVIATRVGGVGEILHPPHNGVLIEDRHEDAIARAVEHLFSNYPDRTDVRKYAERFSWDATTRGQLDLFAEIVKNPGGRVKLPMARLTQG